MAIEIIDNFIDEDLSKVMLEFVLQPDFNWFFTDGMDYEGDTNWMFTHTLYKNHSIHSEAFAMFTPIFEKLNPIAMVRVKLNFLSPTHEIIKNTMHQDHLDDGVKAAIYYLNTNNGYTEFDSGEKCESVQNRLVKFNANQFHTGTTCSDERFRILLNINYY